MKHLDDISKISNIYKEEFENNIEKNKIQRKYNYHYNIYHGITNDSKKEVEKKEFIMRCVKDGCRGFLSQAYKCELCFTYVCKDCMIEKKEKNDDSHICKKEDVDTVAMIRKETRPCPKCGIRISKIDGCDQMWCTATECGTAFSWNTGKIINGLIHNPHYYEWQRRNNNGVAPRNPGDNPCGGFPDYYLFATPLRVLAMSNIGTKNPLHNDVMNIFNVHRCFLEIQDYRLPLYRTTRDAMMFKEYHIDFLMGNITEEKWVQNIFMKELNIEKKEAVLAILLTFVGAGQDLFRGIPTILNELVAKKNKDPQYIVSPEEFKPISNILVELDNLRKYINESLVKTGEYVSTPVPQFNKDWIWKKVSSVESIKIAAKESKEKEKK